MPTKGECSMDHQEAIAAGEQALASLQEAKKKLEGARKLGIADVAGGIFMVSALKQNKMKDAATMLEELQENLRAFNESAASEAEKINLSTEDTLAKTDLMLDNPVSDVKMLDRIKDAQARLDVVIAQVEARLAELRQEA